MPVGPSSGPPPAGTVGTVPAGTGPAQAKVLGEVVVEQVPERIAQLARTIVLSGMVVEQKEGGALLLRTQVGELVIRSPSPLPLDRILTLQIPPGAPPVRAQVSVTETAFLSTPPTPQAGNQPAGTQGRPLPSPLPSTPVLPASPSPLSHSVLPAPVVASGVIAAAAAQAIATLPLIPGTVLPAQVMALPDPTRPDSGISSLLPRIPSALSELQKTGAPALQALLPRELAEAMRLMPPVASGQAVSSDHLPAPAAGQPAPPTTYPPEGGAPGPSRPPPAAAPAFASLPVLLTLPPGSSITLQIERIEPPAAPSAPPSPAGGSMEKTANSEMPRTLPAPSPPSPAPAIPLAPTRPVNVSAPPLFTAIVIGQTPQGEPIATSPAGLLVMANHAPLTAGTTVELSVLHVHEPPPPGESPPPPAPRDWPAMHRLMLDGPVMSALSSRLARPETLAGVTAFLVAALRLGDGQRFIGEETIRVMRERGQGDLVTRALGEFQQIGQTFSSSRADPPPTEWRSLPLPLAPGSDMSRLAVHMRQERDPDAAREAPALKRLVIEVELSRLGPLLLDGYVRPRRFDLTLRSQRRLPRSLRDELRLACRESLAALGWQGGLEFQTSAELWLRG